MILDWRNVRASDGEIGGLGIHDSSLVSLCFRADQLCLTLVLKSIDEYFIKIQIVGIKLIRLSELYHHAVYDAIFVIDARDYVKEKIPARWTGHGLFEGLLPAGTEMKFIGKMVEDYDDIFIIRFESSYGGDLNCIAEDIVISNISETF